MQKGTLFQKLQSLKSRMMGKFYEDAELTQLCMNISEKSLAKDWDSEDDERWNHFLND